MLVFSSVHWFSGMEFTGPSLSGHAVSRSDSQAVDPIEAVQVQLACVGVWEQLLLLHHSCGFSVLSQQQVELGVRQLCDWALSDGTTDAAPVLQPVAARMAWGEVVAPWSKARLTMVKLLRLPPGPVREYTSTALVAGIVAVVSPAQTRDGDAVGQLPRLSNQGLVTRSLACAAAASAASGEVACRLLSAMANGIVALVQSLAQPALLQVCTTRHLHNLLDH